MPSGLRLLGLNRVCGLGFRGVRVSGLGVRSLRGPGLRGTLDTRPVHALNPALRTLW